MYSVEIFYNDGTSGFHGETFATLAEAKEEAETYFSYYRDVDNAQVLNTESGETLFSVN